MLNYALVFVTLFGLTKQATVALPLLSSDDYDSVQQPVALDGNVNRESNSLATMRRVAKEIYEQEKAKDRKTSCDRYSYLASTGRCENCHGLCDDERNKDQCFKQCPLLYNELYTQKEWTLRLQHVEQELHNNKNLQIVFYSCLFVVFLAMVAGFVYLYWKLVRKNNRDQVTLSGKPSPFDAESRESLTSRSDTASVAQHAPCEESETGAAVPSREADAAPGATPGMDADHNAGPQANGPGQVTNKGNFVMNPTVDSSQETTTLLHHDETQSASGEAQQR